MPIGTNIAQAVKPFTVEFLLRHYEATAAITWQVQLQFTRITDPTFASRITALDAGTVPTAVLTNWYYRDEQGNATDGNLLAWPIGGVATNSANVVTDPQQITTRAVYLINSDALLANFSYNERILVRARQTPDDAAFSSWFSWVQRIS